MKDLLAQSPSLRYRLINGTFWNLAATIFGQGGTFIVGVLIARLLQLKEYGEYAMILSTLLSIAGIVQLSIGQTVTKYVAEHRSTDKERAGRILALCATVSIAMACMGALALVATAPIIATHILRAPHLSVSLIMGVGFLLFSVINGYQMGALAGLEAYKALAKSGFASAIVTILSIGVGAWGFGLKGAVIALSISAFLRFVFHNVWLQIELKKLNIELVYFQWAKEKKIIYHFALPAAAAGFFSIPAIWLTNSILVRQSGGYEQMALYSAAFSIRTFVLFVPSIFNTVGLSILNHLKGHNDSDRYRRVFKLNVLAIFLMTTFVVTLVGIFGEYGLRLFGKNFSQGLPVLWVLLFATIPESLCIGLFQHLQSQEKIWLSLFTINIPRETLLIIFALLLAPAFGALGLAYAYAIVHTIALVIVVILIFLLRPEEMTQRIKSAT